MVFSPHSVQKIASDEITIVANAFVIGYVDTNTTDFLYSENMHSIALKRGWWNGEDKLHFTRAFSAGEYTSRYYSGRRMFAFWTALAPSLEVPASYDSYLASIGETYPVSAKPDRKVSIHDVFFNVYRNYYQGTRFDLSVGVAAGPFGTPVRYKPGPNENKLAGTCGSKDDTGACSHWERSIASFRSDLVALTQFGENRIRPICGFFQEQLCLECSFPVRYPVVRFPKNSVVVSTQKSIEPS